jgi:hypothetical protein
MRDIIEFVTVARDEHYIGAGQCEGFCNNPSYSAGCAGDDCGLPFERQERGKRINLRCVRHMVYTFP